MTGFAPTAVGVTLRMLYLNFADAALKRAGKLCATTMSLLSVNLPAAWHSAQALLSVMTPPGCATVWYSFAGSGLAPK